MKDLHEKIINHYIGESGNEYHLVKRKLHDELIPWISKVRAEKIQRFVKESDIVFEYGVGAGWNLFKLKSANKYAFDISDINKDKLLNNNINLIEKEKDIPNNYFDVCICHHVLEHVPSPSDTVLKLYKSLKDNGIAIFVVPLERDISTQINQNDIDAHIFSWTPQTLSNLLIKCGFKIENVSVKKTGYDRYAAMLSYKLKMDYLGYKIIRRILQIIKPDREILITVQKIDN